MTVSLKHAFTSNVADSGDTTLVQPSNWNAEHTLTAAADTLLGAVTAGAVTEITCTAAGRALLDDADAAAQRATLAAAGTGVSNTFTANQIISVTDNTNAALKITQQGTGNAFLVEDASGDTSPFVIDSDGRVGVGTNAGSTTALLVGRTPTGSTVTYGISSTGTVQSDVTSVHTALFTNLSTAAATFSTSINHYQAFFNSVGAGSTIAAQRCFLASGMTQATTNYGFQAVDASAIATGGTSYGFFTNGNIATGGGTAWAFYGAGTAPSVFSGAIGIGSTSISNVNMIFARSITGNAATSHSILHSLNVLSDVTGAAYVNRSYVGTQAAAFTLTSLIHYGAEQAPVGAGSTVTTQYGFFSGSGNIGASTNFAFHAGNTAAITAGKTAHGFYSAINSATGGGTAYALYANGTAPSIFNGPIGIGTTSLTGVSLYLNRNITGSASSFGAAFDGTVQSDATSNGIGVGSAISTAAASFTVSQIQVFRAAQGTIGAGSTVVSLFGYNAVASLIGGTNNYAFAAQDTSGVTAGKIAYGFYSAVNIASGGGTAYAFYAAGTAPSVFSGNVGIGSTSLTNVIFRVSKAITGSTTSYGVFTNSTVQSDVTASAVFYYSGPSTAAAAFTLGNLTHFYADAGTIGAGSSITNQYGFRGDASIVGATTNYSFYAANTAAVTSGKTSYGFYSNVAVASGGGTTWSFYSASTGWNYFSGPTITADVLWVNAPAPAAKTTTATLTAAEIKTGIISATGTSYTLTLPLATDIDSSFSGLPSNTNIGFDFSVVNAASGTVTIAVNTGITNVGSLSVFTGTSAAFRLRRTAANTYIIYRLS